MIVISVGTRPDLIKCAPLIRKIAGCKVFHTGQHYSKELDGQIIKDMGITIDFRLQSKTKGGVEAAYGRVYEGTCAYLDSLKGKSFDSSTKQETGVVVVYGDTLTAMASATAAKACGWRVAHVEAGLRSFDLTMPEEVARIAIDALADRLYAPTKLQASFLKEEGKKTSKVKVLGNVVVNSLKYIQAIQNVEMPLGIGRYALMTLHRQENIRTKALAEIMDAVQLIAVSESIKTVYWPCHPGAVTYAEAILGGSDDRGIIKLVPPMSYGHMIRAVQSAECVFTDSGGLQEETALLGKKCVTFRKSTERQETIVAGYNVLVSPLTHEFMDMVIQAIEHLRTPARPCAKMYGDDPAGLIAEDLKTWRTWI